jgi:hypothetical protein
MASLKDRRHSSDSYVRGGRGVPISATVKTGARPVPVLHLGQASISDPWIEAVLISWFGEPKLWQERQGSAGR